MELSQVKANVRKMVSMGAPMEDIDGYIAAAGWTVDDVRNYNDQAQPAEPVQEQETYKKSLGDTATTALNGYMANLGKPFLAAAGATIDKIKGQKEPWSDLFGQYGAAIEDRQEEYRAKHPVSSVLTEIGGAVVSAPANTVIRGLTKVGTKAATKAGEKATANILGKITGFSNAADKGHWAWRSARQGGTLGGLTGAQQSLEEADPTLGDVVKGTAGGVVSGAVLGPAFESGVRYVVAPVGKAAWEGGKAVVNVLKGTAPGKAIRVAVDKAINGPIGYLLGSRGAAQQKADKILSKSGATSLDELVASEEAQTALNNAVRSDKKFAVRMRDAAEKELLKQDAKIEGIVDRYASPNDVNKAYIDAQKNYQAFLEGKKDPSLVELYKDPDFLKGLEKAQRELPSRNLKQGLDSLATAQEAKEGLNAIAGKEGKNMYSKAEALWGDVASDFTAQLDAKFPGYAQERAKYGRIKQAVEDLKQLYKERNLSEKSNKAKSFLSEQNKQAMTDLVGAEKAEQFFEEIRRNSKIADRLAKLYAAGENKATAAEAKARMGNLRELGDAVLAPIGAMADVLRGKGTDRYRRHIGDILLDAVQNPLTRKPTPSNMTVAEAIGTLGGKISDKAQQIEQQYKEAAAKKIADKGGFVRIPKAGYLGGKLKEKGGYAWKDKGAKKILNSEGNPVATTEEGVKNFNKWFKGSKVVDEQGNPVVVYHGTTDDFSVFDKSKTQTPMFWFTADKASLKDGRTSTNAKGGVKKNNGSIS